MADRTPFKKRENGNNAPDNTARQLVFLTDEEEDALTFANKFLPGFLIRTLSRGLDSLSASLKYGLPITFGGSLAATFIHANVNNALPNILGTYTNTLELTQNFGSPQASFHTPSNPRQRTVLHKDPSTLQLTRYSYTLPDVSEDIDPEEGIPESATHYSFQDENGNTRHYVTVPGSESVSEDLEVSEEDLTTPPQSPTHAPLTPPPAPRKKRRSSDDTDSESSDDDNDSNADSDDFTPERPTRPSTPDAPRKGPRPDSDDDTDEESDSDVMDDFELEADADAADFFYDESPSTMQEEPEEEAFEVPPVALFPDSDEDDEDNERPSGVPQNLFDGSDSDDDDLPGSNSTDSDDDL